MCGILGFFAPPGTLGDGRWQAAIRGQAHRGPDDSGEYRALVHGRELVMAHQRLSIIDLTPAGHQPMGDPGGSGVLVFNGEIYNYLELRRELEAAGARLVSHSDSEVLLQALATWGPEQAVARLNGMWAFAWLEPDGHRLWLSRDRGGEKPLHWVVDGDGLYFASEVKSLLILLGRRFPLDLRTVGRFLSQSLVDVGEGTFFEGIEQLGPASLAVVDLAADRPSPRVTTFWRPSLNEVAGERDMTTRVEALREGFLDAVRIRLRSDVPLGILLSGGVDSSAIAAAAHHVVPAATDLNLLCATSRDKRFDESSYALRVGRHLGRPVELLDLEDELTPDSLFLSLERAVWHNDAPITSLSNLAHLALMGRARELGITVIISGQGADELLCGYKKYLGFYLQWLLRSRRAREAFAVAWGFWRNGTVLRQFQLAEARRYLPTWLRPRVSDLRGPRLREVLPLPLGLAPGDDVRARQAADLTRFSVPTLTHFEDRMSMAESREIRLPFLDPHLMDMLIGTPVDLKLARGWTKYLLRLAVEPWLPAEVVWRKDKQGFINPESEWLKHRLRERVLEYFAPDALVFAHGLVDRDALLSTYGAFCRQRPGAGSVWSRDIFNPLALEIWLRRYEGYVAAA